ncbi:MULTISPECIES: hypothetical protein [Halorussus]|uniref:hypothetical protein n=1 Tax=Halorussus TaxID=1070314 RepID=UPI00209D1736|nr:hypothetical protein [Halorussus vallis]USZ75338.1 hypothetical protein NGM07_18130 [Halorussus vallis]
MTTDRRKDAAQWLWVLLLPAYLVGMAVVGVSQVLRGVGGSKLHALGVAVGYVGYGLCWPSMYLYERYWAP